MNGLSNCLHLTAESGVDPGHAATLFCMYVTILHNLSCTQVCNKHWTLLLYWLRFPWLCTQEKKACECFLVLCSEQLDLKENPR